ncbi:MAG: hypothetical protein AABY22_20605 [Nanoarchaeota archaeon]
MTNKLTLPDGTELIEITKEEFMTLKGHEGFCLINFEENNHRSYFKKVEKPEIFPKVFEDSLMKIEIFENGRFKIINKGDNELDFYNSIVILDQAFEESKRLRGMK